jgi:hypothetical protein
LGIKKVPGNHEENGDAKLAGKGVETVGGQVPKAVAQVLLVNRSMVKKDAQRKKPSQAIERIDSVIAGDWRGVCNAEKRRRYAGEKQAKFHEGRPDRVVADQSASTPKTLAAPP